MAPTTLPLHRSFPAAPSKRMTDWNEEENDKDVREIPEALSSVSHS